MTVEAIKEAIARLPEYERHSLATWLNELEYDDWDRQMVADFSAGGRGAALVDEVRRDITQGKAVPFKEGLDQATARQNLPRR